MKQCSKCRESKTQAAYHVDRSKPDGRQGTCKLCKKEHNKSWKLANSEKHREHSRRGISRWSKRNLPNRRANQAKRHAAKLQRTPSWADLESIKEFYKSCPEGHHVDHIVPLQGETVSGLHVLDNLQYLTAFDNVSKKNRFMLGGTVPGWGS